jgi:hypothetical protein
MSNYSTSYNIGQSGDLYTLQDHGTKVGLSQYNSTRGTTVNAPTNYRKLKLFKGLDNEFFFFVKNQDRKPIMLQNITVNATLVYRETNSAIVSKKCQVTDHELGSLRLVITASEVSAVGEGLCDLILTYTTNQGLVVPLFTDLNMRPNFAVEITEEAAPVPLNSQVVTDFITNGDYDYSSILMGPSYYGKSACLITFGVYTTNYTGRFVMQGTTSNSPADSDWFDLVLVNGAYYWDFVDATGIEPFSFSSNLKFMRAKIDNTGSGSVDKIVVRV